MNTFSQSNQGNKKEYSLSQLQSIVIDFLRFPLAIMVIFIHMNPHVISILDVDFNLLSGQGILNIVSIIMSHVLARIAVPTFFFISGLLFFSNLQKWSWIGYKQKINSRMKTLVVPYFVWNLFTFILLIGYNLMGVWLKKETISDVYSLIVDRSWHIFYDYYEWGTTTTNWLGESLRMTGPYDLPLWFLRDLIVISILTPLIYFYIKKMKIYGVVLLFFAYVSGIWTTVPGFNIAAFFFFSTGAYFAFNQINIITFVKQNKYFILSICFVLFCITTIYDGSSTVIGQNIYPFFVCFGVFSAFYIASTIVEHYHIKPNKFLVSTCFFIYALHYAGLSGSPLALVQRVLHSLIPGQSSFENGVCYLLSPLVAAMLCIVVLVVLRKLCPKLTLLFSGNK